MGWCDGQPRDQPKQSGETDDRECGPPPITQDHGRNDYALENHSGSCAEIEQAAGESSLREREEETHDARAARQIDGFSNSEQDAKNHEHRQ